MSRNFNVHKRRAYGEATLKLAIESVREKKLNVTDAAQRYEIPRQTLDDKIKSKHLGKYGKKTALSTEDEKLLADYTKSESKSAIF